MTTYIALVRLPSVITYTPEGIRIPKNIAARLDRVREAFRASGTEVKTFEITTGRFDAFAILEAGEEAILERALETASKTEGACIETLHVLTVEGLNEILARPVYA